MDIINWRNTPIVLLGIISITFISCTDSRTLIAAPTDSHLSQDSNSLETNNVILPINEDELKEQAMEKLLKVFGLENYTGPNELGSFVTPDRRPRPPPFMLNLYNSVADSTSGITRTPNPYNANTVRAFQDKGKTLLYITFIL